MFGRVNVARSQIGRQQLPTTEDIQWQKTVVPIVTVEKPALLLAVDRVIGGVKVQNELLGWLSKALSKLLKQNLVNVPGNAFVGSSLKAPEC